MTDYDKNTKHMEMIVNLCFTLFSKYFENILFKKLYFFITFIFHLNSLINKESPDTYRILAKLLELFNNISSTIYDKVNNNLEFRILQ